MVLIVAAYLGLNLVTLDRYPIVATDEGYYAPIGYHFWQQGTFGFPERGAFLGFEQNSVRHGRIYSTFVGLAIVLLKNGLYGARLVSLFAAIATVMFTYAIGRRLYGHATGMLAALLLAISSSIFYTSHFARPEMMLTFFFMLSVWYWIQGGAQVSNLRLFITGLLASLAVDVHLNGIFLVVVMAVLLAYDRRLSLREYLAYGLGVSCGLGYWLLAHLLPNPALAWEQLRVLDLQIGTPQSPLDLFRSQALLWLLYFWNSPGHLRVIELGYFLIGTLLILRMAENRKQLLPIIIVFIGNLAVTLLSRPRTDTYLVYWFPFLYLTIAGGLMLAERRLYQRWRQLAKIPLAGILAIPLVCFLLATMGGRLWRYGGSDPERYAALVRRVVPQNAVVMGSFVQWFWLYDRPFLVFPSVAQSSIAFGERSTGHDVEPTFATTIRQYGRMYLIVDDEFRYYMTTAPEERSIEEFLSDQSQYASNIQKLDRYNKSIQIFLVERCQMMTSIHDHFYGGLSSMTDSEKPYLTEIYRCD